MIESVAVKDREVEKEGLDEMDTTSARGKNYREG